MNKNDKVNRISDFFLQTYGSIGQDLTCKSCSGHAVEIEFIGNGDFKEKKCTKCNEGKTRVKIKLEILLLITSMYDKYPSEILFNKYGELFFSEIATRCKYQEHGIFNWFMLKELADQPKETIDFIYWYIFTRE